MELIDRQAVIDLLKQMRKDGDMVPWEGKDVFARIRKLPSVQPEERTEERTESHACDLISQQAAVELAMKYCPDDDGAVQCDGDIRGLLDELENLPSAQPELIAQDAYVRGFEQGRTQGMIDANLQAEKAIPISWIEAIIEKFMMADDAFSGLTASIIRVMLNEWKKEQEGDTT